MTVSPDLASDRPDTARVRDGVARLRRAIADGSLHHHPPQEVPDDRRSHALDVVRAWAAGAEPDAQRRLCGVCTPRAVAPAPRAHD
ncbi:hypothetical protein [Actinomycetospora cinnamomea]|nr:hypothetical protein [Actinomycetospora cinnamomea]